MDTQQILDKLHQLIELNPNGDYGYINKPIPGSDLLDFEAKHQIKLPPDFRAFINQIFDGGIGPWQIMPLSYWDSTHNAVYLDSLDNKLSEPFPLTERWTRGDFKYGRDGDDFQRNAIINGTIRLCHAGCGTFLFLVVNGAEYGNIWVDDRSSNQEIEPLIDEETGGRINFEKWYNDWLDAEIKRYQSRPRRRRQIVRPLSETQVRAPKPEVVETVQEEIIEEPLSFWNRIKNGIVHAYKVVVETYALRKSEH